MIASQLLDRLQQLNVRLWSDGDRLRYSAPSGALTDELLQELRRNKDELLALVLEAERSTDSAVRLEPIGRNGHLPLSSAQEAMWFLQKLDEQSTAYNRSKAIRIVGSLDVGSLESAVNKLVERHESLRTALPVVDGQPVASVTAPRATPLEIFDLSDAGGTDVESQALRHVRDEAKTPFDLSTGPLFRARLLRLQDAEHILLYSMHHIISDGWSGRIFLRELLEAYRAFSEDTRLDLPALPVQYVDYAAWQTEQLQGARLERLLSFWKRTLEASPEELEIPTYRVKPSSPASTGDSVQLTIDAASSDRLRAMARQEGATLFMALLAVFKVLLARYSHQTDIVVGTPIAGRNRAEIQNVIGYFINTLAMRTAVSGDETFRQLLNKVKEVVLGAFANQELPFDKLVEELHPNRIAGHHPIFQVMFVLEPDQFARDTVPGLDISPIRLPSSSSMFDVSLSMKESSNGVWGSLIYKTDLFDRSMIERAAAHYANLVRAVVDDPDVSIARLPMLDQSDIRRIGPVIPEVTGGWNAEDTVIDRFESQVRATPDAEAVLGNGRSLTYRELAAASDSVARHLTSLGVNAGEIVGLSTTRSVHMIAGMIGILKSGAAYLPLDPEYPVERLEFMVRDSGARFVLTDREAADSLAIEDIEMVILDSDITSSATSPVEPLPPLAPESTAYVIYTSGSTGKPKGVEIPHSALLSFTDSARHLYEIAAGDRVLQFASISFDTSAEEIYPCLTGGATLVLRSESSLNSIRTFADECDEHGITHLDLPTAFWNELTDSISAGVARLPKSIRHVIIGGEAARWDTLRLWQKSVGAGIRLWNTYGPTETTVVATACDISEFRNDFATATVPIGKPLPGVEVLVLDEALNEVPIGVRGRLYIGGPGLAKGYLGRPDLTRERFIASPLGDGRVYDTGDRAAIQPDGLLVFLGRSDNQVKVRGFRIELGEIESVLREHENVDEAIVAAHDVGHDKQLAAYVVSARGFDAAELRRHIAETLPPYMVPSHFIPIDSIPLTPNRKIDWKALPKPESSRLDSGQEYEAPRTKLEKQLSEIWEQTLSIPRIGRHDNFFDLGGHSLLAVRLLSKVEQELNESIPIRRIFEIPTIAEMARFLAHTTNGVSGDDWRWLLPINPKGSRIPLFCVHGFAGSVFFFRHVGRLLGPDQPLYGLQSGVLDGNPITETSVEEIAANYVEEVRRARPNGPYVLTAHCAGGKIALEMARQLMADGEEVPMLVLLDVVAPGARDEVKTHKSITGRMRTNAREGAMALLKWAPKAIGFGIYRRYVRKPFYHAHLLVGEWYARRGLKLPPYIREHYAKLKYTEIVRKYKIDPYPSAVTLVRASESQNDLVPDDLGWKDFALGGLRVFDVPIAHVDMVNEDVVAPELLAGIIRTVMSDLNGMADGNASNGTNGHHAVEVETAS